MLIVYFLKGLLIGVVTSAPIGAVGILCIQRTMNKGFFGGMVLGLGAALADLIYASVAGFGLTFISDFLFKYQTVLIILGSVVLVYLGIRIFYSNPVKQFREQRTIKNSKRRMLNDFITSFFLILSNPIAIISFTGFLATVGGIAHKPDTQMGNIVVAISVIGVFTGAMLWWTSLIAVVNIFKSRINVRHLYWINKITGMVVLIFGLLLFTTLFFIDEI